MSKILDGKFVSNNLKDKLKEEIPNSKFPVSLTIIQVGNNPASNTYIKNKVKACNEVGILSEVIKLEANEITRSRDLEEHILNCTTDGLMIQLPLPEGWDEEYYLNLINPSQDADCLTNLNLGKFYTSNNPSLAPCTPQGIMYLLNYYNIDLKGKCALVIGRSNIVGRPIAHLLETQNATVTLAHSKTPRGYLLREFALADIVIVAVGKPNFITEEDALQYNKDYRHDFYSYFETKSNRVIIDVGINRDESGNLCGDLSEEFKAKYSAVYTPVPGGVGPLTVANLLLNTFNLAKMMNVVNQERLIKEEE